MKRPSERARRIASESWSLKRCAKHPFVHFEGAVCPCCALLSEEVGGEKFISKAQAESEFLALSEDMDASR